jgi:hypothetical protein
MQITRTKCIKGINANICQSNLLVDVHCQIMHLNNSCWKIQLHAYQLYVSLVNILISQSYISCKEYLLRLRDMHMSVWRQPHQVDCGDGGHLLRALSRACAISHSVVFHVMFSEQLQIKDTNELECAEEIKRSTDMSVTHEIQDQKHYVVRSVVLYRTYYIIGDCTMMCYS